MVASLAAVTDRIMEIGQRTVVVSNADGDPLFRLKALHAAVLAAVALTTTPRITATVAVGMLFKGLTLDIEVEAV